MLANYIVLNTADAGPGSLRAAIALANADTDTDTIEFNLAAGPQTIQLQSTLEISNSVDIVGPGSANLSIDGGNTVRLFQVTEPASTEVWVGFSGLTLAQRATMSTEPLPLPAQVISLASILGSPESPMAPTSTKLVPPWHRSIRNLGR